MGVKLKGLNGEVALIVDGYVFFQFWRLTANF